MRREKIPSAIKQNVIKEIESVRLSQDEAAKRLDVGKTTIQGWLSKYRSKGDSGPENDHKNRIYAREYNLRLHRLILLSCNVVRPHAISHILGFADPWLTAAFPDGGLFPVGPCCQQWYLSDA